MHHNLSIFESIIFSILTTFLLVALPLFFYDKNYLNMKSKSKISKLVQNYRPTIIIFLLALLAIILMFILTDYKEALAAMTAAFIPMGILSIEMINNKKRQKISAELNKLDQIKSQGISLINSFNTTEFTKTTLNFLEKHYEIAERTAEKFPTFLENYNKGIQLFGTINVEFLKLKLILPENKLTKTLIDKITVIISNYHDVYYELCAIMSYCSSKTVEDITIKGFDKSMSDYLGKPFKLEDWILEQKSNNNKIQNENCVKENTAISYITDYSTELTINITSNFEENTITLISNYCKARENEIQEF